MEYINLTITQLASAAYRRSSMQDRGVWLSLLGFCVQQENGGIVAGAKKWSEWDYQQILGIPIANLKGDHQLWRFKDDDLVVDCYPLDKQREVQAKRRAGKRGGLSRAASSASSSASDRASKTASGTPSKTASTEGNGRERKEKGKKEKGSATGTDVPELPPSLDLWLQYATERHADWPTSDARASWHHYEASGWVLGRGKPVRSWRACVETCYEHWVGAGKKSAVGGGGPGTFENPILLEKPAGPFPHTGGLEVFNEQAK